MRLALLVSAAGALAMGCGEPPVVLGPNDSGVPPQGECARVSPLRQIGSDGVQQRVLASAMGEEFVVLFNSRDDDGTYRNYVARHAAGQEWAAPEVLAIRANEGPWFDPPSTLALDSSGRGVLAWSGESFWAAVFSGNLGAPSVTRLASNPTMMAGTGVRRGTFDAYLGADGAIGLAWISFDTFAISAARLGPDGIVGATETVATVVPGDPNSSDNGYTPGPRVVARADGEMFAVWEERPPGRPSEVYVARRSTSGEWSAKELVSAPGAASAEPTIALVPDGALVAWVERSTRNLAAARFRRGSGWAAEPVMDDHATASSRPRLLLDAEGRGLLTYVGGLGPSLVVAPFDPETGFGASEARAAANIVADVARGPDFALTLQHDGRALGVSCRRNDGTWTAHLPLGLEGSRDELLARSFDAELAMTPSGIGLVAFRVDDELWAATVE